MYVASLNLDLFLQKNIVKNNRITLPYFKWFDFANKSRNYNNKEEDFLQLKEDKDMEEVINRLRKDKLTSEEFNYVSDIHSYDIYVVRLEEEHKKRMARQKKRLEKINFEIEQKKQIAEQEKQIAEQEKQIAEQEKLKAEQEKLKLVKMLLVQGVTIEAIADTLELTIEQTKELVDSVQNNKL